jgi:molecular chaperone GrpE (heat shock protein)
MRDRIMPKLAKWPFLLGDVSLLGVAAAVAYWSNPPFGLWQAVLCLVATAGGAWLCVTPFLREYHAAAKLEETDALADAAAQIQNIESVANRISNATSQWQGVQEQSAKTAEIARQVAGSIAAEAKAFGEALQKANDKEKAHLRLEVEKLRRAEGDWLQILVRLLDHVYALHQAGVRSGQRNLIEQLGQFQNACRDVVRRVGLVPYAAQDGEVFDPKMHQFIHGESKPPVDALVAETLATGYTYQGQLLRLALVNLRAPQTASVIDKSLDNQEPVESAIRDPKEPTLL